MADVLPSPQFATDVNYPAGGDPWSGQPNKVDPATLAQTGFIPATYLASEHVNYELGNHGDWINFLAESQRYEAKWVTWTRAIGAANAYANDMHLTWTAGATAPALTPPLALFNQPTVALNVPTNVDSITIKPDTEISVLRTATKFKFFAAQVVDTVGANGVTMSMGFARAAFGSSMRFYKGNADTNWQCQTDNGGVNTTTNSGVPPVATIPQTFTIIMEGTTPSVKFYIDGTLVATHTTNIDTTNATLPFYLLGGQAVNTTFVNLGTFYARY